MKNYQIKNYQIKNIDYRGCPPEIAEVISSGQMIKCNVRDSESNSVTEVWIVSYNHTSGYPFRDDTRTAWRYAEPTLKKCTYIKTASEIMKQLISDNYEVDDIGGWCCSEDYDFIPEMWQYCGLPLDTRLDYIWKNEWLEEK